MAFPNIIRKIADLISRMTAAETSITQKAPTAHAVTATTYGKGTATLYGHVKLSDAVNGTSGENGGIAATPAAVKDAYTLANTANTTANNATSNSNTAKTLATNAQTTANNAMPKSGGTFTGNVTYKTNAGVILDVSGTASTLGSVIRYPLTVKYKNTTGGVFSTAPFNFIPSPGETNLGSGFMVQGRGALVLSSGESGDAYISGSKLDGETENLYLTADGSILFVTKLQSGYSEAKTMTFNNSGNLVLPTGSTISGASAFKGKADTAGKADQLTTARSLKVALNKTGSATFNGTADQNSIPVQGILATANGGTGNAEGKAPSATTADKLKTARNLYVKLGNTYDSSSPVTFDGSAAKALPVSGVLPIAHGGTGRTDGGVAIVPNIKTFTLDSNKSWTAPAGTWVYLLCGNWNSQNLVGKLTKGQSVTWPNAGHDCVGIAIRIA